MKTNQITAISAAVIAIGVVYTIVNNAIKDQQLREIQRERAIEFQKRQKFNATNTFCREKFEGGFVREYMYDDIYKFTARRILKECMAANGYENVECGYYGVCEKK